MIDLDVVDLSRLQFAVTAMYHFLFVPLTIGLSLVMAIMESIYVMTGLEIWRRMTRFWGVLFGINFAMGIATGLTMEFQFGTNWAYYSQYVGDVFGVPLALEGLMAFFLESTFVGLFFFGWRRLSRLQHLAVTWLTAIGANLSALWILIANGWMQNPVGASFNVQSMRMELDSISEVILNPVAQAKFVHTVAAGYVTGALFVLSISAWYLLRGRHRAFAQRSMAVAASFGLASALSVAVLGDESGYLTTEHQQMKVAAFEAMWETEPPPASFTLIGLPDVEQRTTHYDIEIPYVLGLVATRSLDRKVAGIDELVTRAEYRIHNGLRAYKAMLELREHPDRLSAFLEFREHSEDLGYALLLKRHLPDPRTAGPADIRRAAEGLIPNVPVLFWSFRIMVCIGFYLIGLFMLAFYLASRHRLERHRAFLQAALWSLPLPWIAMQTGWLVAEYGRQPWVIEGVLPTFLGASALSTGQVWFSLTCFVLFYSALLVVDVFLMLRAIRLGPPEPPVPETPGAPAGAAPATARAQQREE